MNEEAEQASLLYWRAKIGRKKQICAVNEAIEILKRDGALIPAPAGISKARWKAMIKRQMRDTY